MAEKTTIIKLHDLFDKYEDFTELGFQGSCADCGRSAEVVVKLAEKGFRISGGAVYERAGGWKVKCDECYRRNPALEQEAEVFSRCVGYYRPVKNWNEGKQAEFYKRETFDKGLRGAEL